MAQRGSAFPPGRGKEGGGYALAVRRVAPLAQHGKALHGTARAAPASRGASQRHPWGIVRGLRDACPPLAPASPPFAVAVSTCGVAISGCGVLTFRNTRRRAHPPTEGARAAAGPTTEMEALPLELIHQNCSAGVARGRVHGHPSRKFQCSRECVAAAIDRAGFRKKTPLQRRDPHSDRATSEKARNALSLSELFAFEQRRPRRPDPNPDRQPFVRAFSSSLKRPSRSFSGRPQKNTREP